MLNELDVIFGTMLHIIVSKFLFDYKIITYTFEFRLNMMILKLSRFDTLHSPSFGTILNITVSKHLLLAV
jgi:hypothetical protein